MAGKKTFLCVSCDKPSSYPVNNKSGVVVCRNCYQLEYELLNPILFAAGKMMYRIKKTCKEKKWPKPDFDTEYLVNKIKSGKCEVTGIKFQVGNRNHKAKNTIRNPYVPSIDRIDSSQPYRKDNVQMVVFMYNVCKSRFEHEDVVRFCQAVIDSEKLGH